MRSCICPDKAKVEDLLKAAIMEELDALPVGQLVMLKLTLPDKDDLSERDTEPAERSALQRSHQCSSE